MGTVANGLGRQHGTQSTMVDSDDDRPLLRDVAPLHTPDHCGYLECRVGEASNPGPVQTRQARRAEHDQLMTGTISQDDKPLVQPCVQDTAQDNVRVSRRRRRLRALPLSWDSDTESDGPEPRQARRSQRSVITQVDASSNEEFLLRPNSGRHVVPRTDGELPTTVPASPGALYVAGLLRSVRQRQSSPLAVVHQSSTASLRLRE